VPLASLLFLAGAFLVLFEVGRKGIRLRKSISARVSGAAFLIAGILVCLFD